MKAVPLNDRAHAEPGDLLAEATGLATGDHPAAVVVGADLLPLCLSVLKREEGFTIVSAGEAFPVAPDLALRPVEALIVDLGTVVSGGVSLEAVLERWGNPEVLVIAERASSAIDAFRIHASAFLMRPVSEAELVEAVSRLRSRLVERRAGRISATLLELLERRTEKKPMVRFPLRNGGRISFLRAEEIDWLEAERDYVCFHVGAKKHLLRARISEMEKRLPESLFARIHRSVIVNLDRVRELHPLSYGEYAVVLTDGKRLTLSRSHRTRVLSLLTQACSA